MKQHHGILLALALALSACTDVDETEVGATDQTLENGFDQASTPLDNATVHWEPSGCSGTLVSPTQVLTAAHCLRPRLPSSMPSEITASTIINGELVVAAGGRRLYAVAATVESLTPPWTAFDPTADVTAAGAYAQGIYVVRAPAGAVGTLERSVNGGPWVPQGVAPAAGVSGLALTTAWVYAIDGTNLWRRARLATEDAWELIEPAAGATALTADAVGHVYGGFADGSIRMYTETSGAWETLGSLAGVQDLASDGVLLFGAAGGRLWMRRADAWAMQGWWDIGDAGSVVGLASTRTHLHRFAADGQWHRRLTVHQWEPREAIPVGFEAMATSGNDLFGLGFDRHLYVRDADDPAGAWTDLGEQQAGWDFLSMTAVNGKLYAVGATGLIRRPATRTAGPTWTAVNAGSHGSDMLTITVANGGFWALGEDGRIFRRNITDLPASWIAATSGDGEVLEGHGNTLFRVADIVPTLNAAPAPATATSFEMPSVPRLDPWHSSLAYRTLHPVRVHIGNDIRTWQTVRGCHFRHPGDTDVALLELDAPVDPALAIPVPILYDEPSSDPDFWETQSFTTSGWGAMADERRINELLERSGSSWTEVGTVPDSTVSLSRSATAWVAVDRDGLVSRRTGSGAWDWVTFDRRVNAAATSTTDFVMIRDHELVYYDVGDGTAFAPVPVSLDEGERMIAGTFLNGLNLYVATSTGRILRVNVLNGVVTDTGKRLTTRALASDSTYLYAMAPSGNVYRGLPSDTAWTSLGNFDPATTVAAWAGTIYGSTPSQPRYRQTGVLDDWHWPHAGTDPRRATVTGSVTSRVGDSGAPLYWWSAGVRYVMGVTQGTQANGGRFVLTYYDGAPVSGKPQQNKSAWLRTMVAEGTGEPLPCE